MAFWQVCWYLHVDFKDISLAKENDALLLYIMRSFSLGLDTEGRGAKYLSHSWQS
jgi:hypothetical protein